MFAHRLYDDCTACGAFAGRFDAIACAGETQHYSIGDFCCLGLQGSDVLYGSNMPFACRLFVLFASQLFFLVVSQLFVLVAKLFFKLEKLGR